MDEYIERESVLSEIRSCLIDLDNFHDDLYYGEGINKGLSEAIIAIDEQPNADVLPVIHGYWIPIFENAADEKRGVAMKYKCSECGGVAKDETYSHALDYEFCPRCGAKMNGLCKSDNWIATSEQLPPENQIVDTKIDDEKGLRNECQLIFSRNLWWLPDKSMYVYYSPTHWRYSTNTDKKDGECNG